MPAPQSYLGLYRSGLTSAAHRRKITVAREHVLEDAMGHLRACMDRGSKHHMLFIGPRGVGKSHLLSLIEDEIAADPTMAARFVVARFPEESHRTLSFADFLLGLCEILQDRLPEEPQWRQLHDKLASEEDNSIIVDTLVPLLRQQNRERKRTLVVMLENLNEMFTSQIRHQKDIGAMRKFFMDDNGCLLIATTPIHFEGVTSVEKPFYDFFDVQTLEPLDKEQAIALIRRNLEWDKRDDLLADFATMRPKLMALHDMTGGSPRLTLMLYSLIAHDSVVEVRQQFLLLLDQVTPFYQDRLRDMSPQERALLDTMATMRGQDKTPSSIAAAMRMGQAQTSALLKRLTESKYLRHSQHPTDKRSRLYTIREGFFDLWLAMNLTRNGRRRLPVMVEWLSLFYVLFEEREQKRRELREKWGSENATEALDLLSEMGPPDEKARAKLELYQAHTGSGNHSEAGEYLKEARLLPLDPMGTWIVQHASDRPATNYLEEMKAMLDCWTTHRSGELEAFAEKLSKLGEGLTLKTFSETKLGFLREHLALLADAKERVILRNRIGNLLCEMARWQEAEGELRAALDEAAASKKAEAWLSVSLNNLAQLLNATNRLAEAEPLMRQSLAIDQANFGEMHPNVAIRLNNLAHLLQATNRLAEAEPLMRQALAIDQASFGDMDPNVATRLNNLAQLLHDTNRLTEAEPLMRQALAIDQANFGAMHSKVSIRLNNLAQLLMNTNRLTEAEPLMRQALAIDQASFSDRHPSVAICLSNLAQLLQATNRLAEAEPLMRQALAIDQSSFGSTHPEVARDLNNLAHLLQASNRLAEAEPLMRESLAIDQASFGYMHPNVAVGLNNLAVLLVVTNRLAEAEPLMRQALAIDHTSFGDMHPKVALRLNNLSQLLQTTGRLAEAEPLMKRALEILVHFQRVNGHQHPNFVTDATNYRILLQATGLSEGEAQAKVQEVLNAPEISTASGSP